MKVIIRNSFRFSLRKKFLIINVKIYFNYTNIRNNKLSKYGKNKITFRNQVNIIYIIFENIFLKFYYYLSILFSYKLIFFILC